MSRPLLPVAILAGGLATRLRPVTATSPKSLIDINGEPFIAHQLRLLHSRGIERVALCVGYLGERIERAVGDGAGFGLAVEYSYDGPQLRGTGGAIHQALPLLGERFFVLYGDSYLDCDYRAVQEAFERSGKSGLMTVFANSGKWDTSNVEFRDGEILAYDKKNLTPRMKHIDYGLGVFDRGAFSWIEPGSVIDLASVYQELQRAGKLAGFEVDKRFYEIGSFAGMEELSRVLRETESSQSAGGDRR